MAGTKGQPKPRGRPPRPGFMAVCTVPGCRWSGPPEGTEKRARRSVGPHAAEVHTEIRSVLVRRVIRTEVVEA
jgi:hypothetical protein